MSFVCLYISLPSPAILSVVPVRVADPDPHGSAFILKARSLARIKKSKFMSFRAQNGTVDTHNRVVEAQNGALVGTQTSGRRLKSLSGSGSGSAFSAKLDPDPHLSENVHPDPH